MGKILKHNNKIINLNGSVVKVGIENDGTVGLIMDIDAGNPQCYVSGETFCRNLIYPSMVSIFVYSVSYNMQGDGCFYLNEGYIDFGEVLRPYLDNATQSTISFWCKVSMSDSDIVIGNTNPLDYRNGIALCYRPSGMHSFYIRKNNTASFTCEYFNSGDWVNIVGVYNGSLTISKRGKIYINGDEQSASYYSTPPNSLSSNNGDFSIGAYPDEPIPVGIGYVNDIRVHDRALTTSEIIDYYNAEKVKYL